MSQNVAILNNTFESLNDRVQVLLGKKSRVLSETCRTSERNAKWRNSLI